MFLCSITIPVIFKSYLNIKPGLGTMSFTSSVNLKVFFSEIKKKKNQHSRVVLSPSAGHILQYILQLKPDLAYSEPENDQSFSK